MSFRIAKAAIHEVVQSLAFSLALSSGATVVALGLWSANISLVQADVVADFQSVFVASALPAFFAAWAFFLVRRFAWSGAAEAGAVAGAVSSLAVLAHNNVLASSFFVSGWTDLPSIWLQAASGFLERDAALPVEGGVMAAEVVVVFIAVVAAVLAQRFVARRVPV